MRKYIAAAVTAAFAAEPGDIGYDPHADTFERFDA
jgi:hypothetical protein